MKHQHFVPKAYLKNFAHTKERNTFFVDTFNKMSNSVLTNLSINDICVETNLYTLNDHEGDDKYQIEKFFSKNIENRYNNVYNLLVKEKKEFITASERLLILNTTLSIYFRSPKMLNQFVKFTVELVERIKNNEQVESLNFLGMVIPIKHRSISQIKKEIRDKSRINYLKAQLLVLSEFIRHKSLDGLTVIELIGNQQFITGDNPVIIRNSRAVRFDLFDVNNSIYIPLDSKHALFIAPKIKNPIINQVFYQRDNFFQHIVMNYSICESSERWVIGTKEGIEQFLVDKDIYSQPSDDNHPVIVKSKLKLSLMNRLLNLVENGISNENVELIKFMKEFKEHELFAESVDFQDAYVQLKEAGLII